MESSTSNFALQRIYLKDLSFESPVERVSGDIPNVVRFDLDLENTSTKLEKNVHEVCLNLTGKGVNEEQETIYLIEVAQAGLFLQSGEIEEELLRKVILVDCPTIVYPYLRETVDSVLLRGGWPPVAIGYIDFKANYMKAIKGS